MMCVAVRQDIAFGVYPSARLVRLKSPCVWQLRLPDAESCLSDGALGRSAKSATVRFSSARQAATGRIETVATASFGQERGNQSRPNDWT